MLLISTMSLASFTLASGPDYVQSYSVKSIEYKDGDVEAIYIQFATHFKPEWENSTVGTLHITGESKEFALQQVDYYLNDNNTWYFVEREMDTLPMDDEGWYVWAFYERCDVDDFHIFLTIIMHSWHWWNWDYILTYVEPSEFEIEEEDDDNVEFVFDQIYIDWHHIFLIVSLVGFSIGMLVLSLLPLTKRGYELKYESKNESRSSYRFRME